MKKFLILLLVLALFSPLYAAVPNTFEWDAPTTNANGTPLNDLAGFKIHCGSAAGTYNTTKDVGILNATATGGQHVTIPVNQVLTQDGNYYCVVTAYDTVGNESGYSNEINFTINLQSPNVPSNFK